MRRFLLLVMALLLPLQLTWGAVSGYCQHESGAASKHFAHHEHVHKSEAKKAADLKVVPDNDCSTCHGIGVTALVDTQAALPVLGLGTQSKSVTTRDKPSLPPELPDRPQWLRLVA